MRENDARIIEKIRALDADSVIAEALNHRNACGPGGLAVAMAAARARGGRAGHILEYTTSHEVTAARGPFTTAVGYLGAVF